VLPLLTLFHDPLSLRCHRAIHGNVGYFGSTQNVPIIIDYPPWVALSAPSSVIIDQPATVTTSAADVYLNLTAHALDYKPPGGYVPTMSAKRKQT
jgi:hypothetical protein